MKDKASRVIFTVAIGLLFVAVGILVYYGFNPDKIPKPKPAQSAAVTATPIPTPQQTPGETGASPAFEAAAQSKDKLFITLEREYYTSGALVIVIPRLGYQKTVGNGTSEATLKTGPGLYDYAQLPNESNHNTSIAALRKKSDFYYLDEMAQDDYFYLMYGDFIYRYLYEQTYVVEPSDWSPIYNKGYSMLTLTAGTPAGTSDQRMIVTATLDAVFDNTDDFIFFSNANESSQGAESADETRNEVTDG